MESDLAILTPFSDGDELNIVSRSEFKREFRMSPTITKYDDVIDRCIKSATAQLHGRRGVLNRTVVQETLIRYYRQFPRDKENDIDRMSLWLPYPPVQSVTSVKYLDTDGVEQTLDPAKYVFIATDQSARVELLPDETWPDTKKHPRAVYVEYIAGYVTSPTSNVPQHLKRLILILAGHEWENSEATLAEPRVVLVNRQIHYGVEWLIQQLKVALPYGDSR